MTMLAKQFWRLHTSPNSLIAQCYKAKYFLETDKLKASVGSHPSYASRSLHHSISVLNKGCC